MPAIGASTTGVSTRSEPRVRESGTTVMTPLSERDRARPKSTASTPSARLGPPPLLDRAGPRDRVVVLRRLEDQVAHAATIGDEVDQAHRGLVPGLERLRQRAALAGGEVAAEGPRCAERARGVTQIERDVLAAEV